MTLSLKLSLKMGGGAIVTVRLQVLTLPRTSKHCSSNDPLLFGSINVPVTITGEVVPALKGGIVTLTLLDVVTVMSERPAPESCTVMSQEAGVFELQAVGWQLGAVVSVGTFAMIAVVLTRRMKSGTGIGVGGGPG